MENPTRFDLTASLELWRREISAQPALTPGDQRELETHLNDTIADLRQRGLNDGEAFWLARRRVGQPQRIAAEFAKAEPIRHWRERLFWMAIALFALRFWYLGPLWSLDYTILDAIRMKIFLIAPNNYFVPEWMFFYLPWLPRSLWGLNDMVRSPIFGIAFRTLPLICGGLMLLPRRKALTWSKWRVRFGSFCQFLFGAMVASFVIGYGFAAVAIYAHSQDPSSLAADRLGALLIRSELGSTFVCALGIVLLAWLLPNEIRRRKTSLKIVE